MATQKVVVNVDAGIDAGIALLAALRSSELEIIGITTSFGAASPSQAIENTLRLCASAGRLDIPIVAGAETPLQGSRPAPSPAHYANGNDCLGDLSDLPAAVPTQAQASVVRGRSAAQFLAETVAAQPGSVAVLQMGPLTNLAQAILIDSSFVRNVRGIWMAGGSFYGTGDVNTAAEFSILADPEAADAVLTSGANVTVVGLNVTSHVTLQDADITELGSANTNVSGVAHDMARRMQQWCKQSDHLNGIFLHGGSALISLLRPSVLKTKAGAVRVETVGLARGHTMMDYSLNNWYNPNPWVGQPPAQVGISIDAVQVASTIKSLIT